MSFELPQNLEVVEAYLKDHTTPDGPLLERLIAETHEQTDAPQMLTGPVEGRFLETLVFVSGARNVLEIGTFTGYSARSMASALGEDGRVVTCEIDEHHASIARRYFAESPHGSKVDLRMGPALETIAAEPGPWDLVFIDAEKDGYPGYFDAVVPKLAPRGLVVADNTLRSGTVFDPGDESGEVMRAFNDKVRDDPRVESVMLSVRDGMTLARLSGR